MFGINKKFKNAKKDFKSATGSGKKGKNGKDTTVKKPSPVPDLICKSFTDGCLVVGCVHETTSTELIVSLPGIGNFGHVKLNNISKIYTNLLKSEADNDEARTLSEIYNKGDFVRCKVLGYSDRKLNLTVEPDLVNSGLHFNNLQVDMVISGAVKSKEDHGYTVDIGVESLNAFVNSTDIDLVVGKCCLFKVESKKNERAIKLAVSDSLEPYDLANKVYFDAYLPGARLHDITVERVTKNGLQVNITKQISGYVHLNHLPAAKRAILLKEKSSKAENNFEKAYSNGDKISATVIFVNPYSRIVYLSMLPHLNDTGKSAKVARLLFGGEEEVKIGQVVDDAQISMVNQKGVFIKFKLGNAKQISGFIPKRHLFESDAAANENDDDEEEENVNGEKLKKVKKDAKNMTKEDLLRHFPVHSTLKTSRIYDYNLIEDILLLSRRESVLKASCMSYDELECGQVVQCQIVDVNGENGGVRVKLSEFVRGFIPRIHTGDAPLSETLLRKKMKRGGSIKCRVLSVEAGEKRCILTAKKTLVKSKLPLITRFDEVEVGMQTYGVVVSIKDYGLLLGFFDDLKGLLPRDQISRTLAKTQNLTEIYSIGQLIKCRVLDFNKEKRLIKLSLLMEDKDATNGSSKAQAQNGVDNKKSSGEEANGQENNHEVELEYEAGEMVETATIVDANEKGGFFRLKLPRGTKSGLIYKAHLSDLESLNDALFDYYKQVRFIRNLLVVNKQITYDQIGIRTKISRTSVTLTLKTSLIEFYTKQQEVLPRSFGDLTPNIWYHGWTRKILPNGVLVEIVSNLNGFCSNEKIAYLDEIKSGLVEGQSVLIKVGKLFDDKKRFTTSLKTRFDLCKSNQLDVAFLTDLTKSALINTNRLFKYYSTQKSPTPGFWEKAATKAELGKTVRVAVKSYSEASGRLECLFMSDIEQNGFSQKSDLIGYAYLNPASEQDAAHKYKPGQQLDALVIAFDPMSNVFCLLVDKEHIKVYKKNFDAGFRAKTACKMDQDLKAEVVFVSEWFAIVGLKQHAKGRLAIMPLFKNDFTQLNTFRALNDDSEADLKKTVDVRIKQKQVVSVSSAQISEESHHDDDESSKNKKPSSDKRFGYFSVGELIKVIVKDTTADAVNSDVDLLIVKHDHISSKSSRKQVLRQLAILNESGDSSTATNSSAKRKADDVEAEEESGEVVKKKKVSVVNGDAKEGKDAKLKRSNDVGDSLEVVASVKKPKLEASKQPNHQAHGEKKQEEFVFPWEVTDFDQFDAIVSKASDSSKDDESHQAAKKKANKKEKEKTIDDRLIYENEEQVFNPNREPESSDDFERLIASKPNCSLLWIKYIVFYLQMAEIDKARNVAQQALKTILYKEEQERLNVWVALLNLENMYGTQMSLDETFNKATQNCDSFKVHCHMAEIFARSSKLQDAEGVFMKMIRKFSKAPEAWTKYGIFHYKNGNAEAARKLLIRSFNSLDKKDHIDMVNKFAQLEFKYGDIERGKTMYDSLLFTYQNRTDIWSVYIDMLVRHEKYDDARHIFNRIIQMGLTSKRMKFIFKKFLDFEKAHGSEDSVEKVKELAVKYVEKPGMANGDEEKKNAGVDMKDHLKKNLNI